ncbi:MAG: dimethyl sulfoxide reductase subunit C [Ardenticatenaceae bacterium]|nr:MAG: dimethyl sulfoxide reductase subunit C [Ardenticatenaceae bacterium]
MNVHDWALVLFTILGQMAVGAFVILGIVHFYAQRKANSVEADRMSDRALLIIGPVLVLGMLASLLHLGNPLNAYKAVANIGSSWLSMEILAGVLFAAFGALFALVQWRKIGSFAMRRGVALLAALVGLWLVFSMAQVYMLRTVPTWNNWATPVKFFTTTFLLGSLAMGAAFVANYAYLKRSAPDSASVQGELLRGTLRWIAMLTVVLLGVEFLSIPLTIAFFTAGTAVTVTAVSTIVSQYTLLFILRLVLVFVGGGILAVFLYRNALSAERETIMGNLAYTAFALVLVAEILGRFLFYASYARVGI